MARIPVYSQGVSARQGRGPGMAGGVPAVDGGGLALARAGAAISNIGEQAYNVEQRKQEEDAAAWSAEQLSKARLDWTQQQIEREQNAPAGAANYTGQLTKDYDEYTENLIKSAPTDKAREYLRNRMTDLKTSVVGRGMQFEATSRLNDRINKIGSAVDTSRIAVDLDPSQFQSVLAENLATLDALDIPEAKKVEIRDNAKQQLSFAAVASRMRSNPGAVLQQLGSEDGGGALDVRMLNADNRIRLRTQAEAELKRREAEAKQAAAINRAEMTFRLQDAQAAYMQGLQYDNPPTAAELQAVYGEEKGQQVFNRLTKTQQFGIDVQQYATLPVSERAAWIESRKPAADGMATEGYAEDLQLFGQLVKNADNINKQMAEDGAGYAIKYSPEVAAAWQGVMTADPDNAAAAYQTYAEAVKGEQARLGLPNVTVVPKSYVSQMAAAFKDPANQGTKQVEMVKSMQQTWGQHFPQVFSQIQSEVPNSVKIISNVDDDTAVLLSSIAPVDNKTLAAPLLSADVTLMKNGLKEGMSEFAQTFAAQGGSGLSTYNAVYGEAERGAMALMANGMSPSEAAEQMTRRLTQRYTRDNKLQVDGSLRVPADYDMDIVQEGAQAVLSRLTADDVLIKDVPGISPEARDTQFRNILRASQMVTNKDETGVFLMYNGAAIAGKDGRPLTMTFEELMGAAGESESANSYILMGDR